MVIEVGEMGNSSEKYRKKDLCEIKYIFVTYNTYLAIIISESTYLLILLVCSLFLINPEIFHGVVSLTDIEVGNT